MEIVVIIQCVYGRELIRPVCQKARLFADIAGTETLTHSTISHIKQLGYIIRVAHAHNEFL